MKPLITLEQIIKYVKVSANTRPEDINPSILDAQQFDIVKILPDALLNAVEANLISNLKQWDRNRDYVTGDKIFYDTPGGRKYYKCLTNNTDSIPYTDTLNPTANWAFLEIMNFYTDYIVPYMAYAFYYRFIAYHGANVTQFGIVGMTDSTFQAITDGQRGAILGDIKSKKATFALKMSKEINRVNYTFDSVVYTVDTDEKQNLRNSPSVFGLGNRHKDCKRKWGWE